MLSQAGAFVATLPSLTPLKMRRNTVVLPEPDGPWTTPSDHSPASFAAGKSGGEKTHFPSNSKSKAADAARAHASTFTWHTAASGSAPSPSTIRSMASGSMAYEFVTSRTRPVSRLRRRSRAKGIPAHAQSHLKSTRGGTGLSVGRTYTVSSATS